VGAAAAFVVLSADNAGNVEAAPEGIALPPYNPGLNLGTAPTASQLIPETHRVVAPAPDLPVTNPLFLEALREVPGALSGGLPSAFAQVSSPFTAAAFFTGGGQSGAGIGPLAVVLAPDGTYGWVSGGPGRNDLWKITAGGGAAGVPNATLDLPVYQMRFDAQGLLWASTGGGPLVRLDPQTGQIMERFGDGIELGLALHPTSGELYCASAAGIEIFNPLTGAFRRFSSSRVQSLAFSPEGVLYATAWPADGHVLRFDARGNAEIFFIPPSAALGLAIGPRGTPLENLMFLSHGDQGYLTLVDLVTHRSVRVAQGGSRGGFLHASGDGRLFVAQSDRVDVFFPVTAPLVVAVTPVDGLRLLPVVTTATVRFDVDMWDGGAAAGSATDPAAYALVNPLTGRQVPVRSAVYDPAARSVTLFFEPLPAGDYQLRVSPGIRSQLGLALEEAAVSGFTVMVDVTASLKPRFGDTRLDMAAGLVSFEAHLTNTLDFEIRAPFRLIFTGLQGTTAALEAPDGVTDEGHPYVDLAYETGVLAPGQTTAGRTLAIRNPDLLALHLITRVTVDVGLNQDPVITSARPGRAKPISTASKRSIRKVRTCGTCCWPVHRGPGSTTTVCSPGPPARPTRLLPPSASRSSTRGAAPPPSPGPWRWPTWTFHR
jgi:hypothetical protein